MLPVASMYTTSVLHRWWNSRIELCDHSITPRGWRSTFWRIFSESVLSSTIFWRLRISLRCRRAFFLLFHDIFFSTAGVGALSLHPDSNTMLSIFSRFCKCRALGSMDSNCLAKLCLSSARTGRLFNSSGYGTLHLPEMWWLLSGYSHLLQWPQHRQDSLQMCSTPDSGKEVPFVWTPWSWCGVFWKQCYSRGALTLCLWQ